MVTWLLLFLTSLTFLSSPARSQEPSSRKIDCEGWAKKDTLNQTEMNTCAMVDANAARKKLDALIEELRTRFLQDKENFGAPAVLQWQQLEENQKSWAQLTQKECAWESAFFDGGSIQLMVRSLCIARQTKERISRLRVFLCEDYSGEFLRSQAYRN